MLIKTLLIKTMKYKFLFIILPVIVAVFYFLCSLSSARTLTDQLGRQVILSDSPRRIVALAPSITEIIFALQQQHRLKGVTMFSDFPAEAAKIPGVGSYVHLDVEKIVSLKPDLCIAVKDGNPKDVVLMLESFQIPVYAVNPENLESVMKTILEIGKLLGVEKKAGALVKNMSERIANIKNLVSKTSRRPGVFFQIGISPIVAAGTNTFIHELIIFAGGKNVSEGKIAYPRFSVEQVLAMSPEIIIITSMARGNAFKNAKAGWSRWLQMPAAKNNQIFLVDSNIFDRPTPRMVDGLELLARLIHPELF